MTNTTISSSTSGYSLPADTSAVAIRARFRELLLHDLAGADDDSLAIQARLQSGDYFVTLATELDALRQSLDSQDIPEADFLGRLIDELHYLQEHYALKRLG